jgi:hypothetical protein
MTNIIGKFGLINKYPEELVTDRKDGKFKLNRFGKLKAVEIVSGHFGLKTDEFFKLNDKRQLEPRSSNEIATDIAKKHFRQYKEEKALNSQQYRIDSQEDKAAHKKIIKGYSDIKLSGILISSGLYEKDIENELIAKAKNKLEKTIGVTENNLLQYAAKQYAKQYKIKCEIKEFHADLNRIGSRVLGVVSRVVIAPLFAIAAIFQGIKTIGKAVLSVPVESFHYLRGSHNSSGILGFVPLQMDVTMTIGLFIKTLGCFNLKKDVSLLKGFEGIGRSIFWEGTNDFSACVRAQLDDQKANGIRALDVGGIIKMIWKKTFPPTAE